jgi:hypothetical protein
MSSGSGVRRSNYTVKNAVELLGVPERNTSLMSNKYNSNAENFCLSTQVVFFHSVMERECLTLEQSKKSM